MHFRQRRYWRRSLRGVRLLARSAACAILAIGAVPQYAAAQEFTQRDSYGEPGLLDMPSARMAPDGEIALTLSAMDNMQRGTLSFQILPWLEGSFRYTRIGRWANSVDYDRSFGLKLRLVQEDATMPDISVGIRDLVGTGIYGAEYVAASKHFLDFDITAGVGWGRLADDATFANPFAQVFSSFKQRKVNSALGGQVDFGSFFHGRDMGAFGGVIWHTPIENLNLTAEYSSDRYLSERAYGGFKGTSPFNFGLTYEPVSGIALTAGWFYGYSYGASITVFANPSEPASPAKLGAAPMPVSPRTDAERQNAVADFVTRKNVAERLGPRIADAEIMDRTLMVDVHASGQARKHCSEFERVAQTYRTRIDQVAVSDLDDLSGNVVFCAVKRSPRLEVAFKFPDDADSAAAEAKPPHFDSSAAETKIRADAAAQGLRVEALVIGPQDLTIYYTDHRYAFESEAIGRLWRVLMADAPPSVEAFHLVPVISGVPAQDVLILRAPMERMYDARGSPAELGTAVSLSAPPLDNPALADAQSGSYPRVSWAVSPSLRQGLFDPNQPLRIQAYLDMTGAVELQPGLSLEGAFEANIYNTFNTKRLSNSVLPHVRSDVAEYLTEGKNGISALDFAYRARAGPDIFVEAKAGYLEDMFAGAGAQALWRPEGERWALGADLYDVWQRDYDRLFGLKHYHVLTGHVSFYYRSPWHGIGVNVHAGRYLAGDWGATFEVTRRFSTGVEIGAFATFTTVPFEKFGEGSFDKGVMLNIPLEWALPLSTQSSYNLTLRPLTRDGGQRLEGDDSLYGETERTSYDEITAHESSIAYP